MCGHVDSVASESAFSPDEIERLRAKHYNATLAAILPVHEDLRIIRVRPDSGMPLFDPGQYFTLGLGNWESRVAGVDEEHLDATHQQRLSQRAYSASCSILDEKGRLKRITDFPYLEFYLALVRHNERRPPALTPRLFALKKGQRLFVSPQAVGRYTLHAVAPECDVFFFATGTGEAPHNTMVAELLARGHRGRIISAVSVRYLRDAAYRTCHEQLLQRFSNYHYFLSVTRESPNPAVGVGSSQRLQDAVMSGRFERAIGIRLDPARAHVFLCGNPAMIGLSPDREGGQSAYQAGSMLDILLRRGFQLGEHEEKSNLHFERYW